MYIYVGESNHGGGNDMERSKRKTNVALTEPETADVQVSNTYIYRDSEENDEDDQPYHFISFDPNSNEMENVGPELNHIFGVETKSIGTQYMY